MLRTSGIATLPGFAHILPRKVATGSKLTVEIPLLFTEEERQSTGSPRLVTGWTEKHISSEVTRDFGPLLSGASVPKTSSKIQAHGAVAKIKRASQKTKSISNTLALRQAYQQTVAMHKGAERLRNNSRAFMHLAVLGAAMAVVFGSGLVSAATRTQAVSQVSTANGLVATLDPAVSAQVAANVARNTGVDVNAVASLKGSNVADEATLAGDENALAKQEVISVAQSLRRSTISYTVQEGDSVDSIAKQYNVTSDTIRWANGIKNDADLKPGQTIKVLPVSGIAYTVQAGDTVDMIAAKFHSNSAAIMDFNDADVKGFNPGMEIVIPDGSPATVAVARSQSSGSISTGFFGGRGAGSFANTYTRGQCTWYVASRRQVPSNWGNAISWYWNAKAAGYATGTVPRAGAIGWERMNHVVYVESVNPDGSVNISEMNWGGRPGVVHYRTTPASHFLYIY